MNGDLEIKMTASWGDHTITINQSSAVFSSDYNEALEANTRRVAEALINLARYEIKEN